MLLQLVLLYVALGVLFWFGFALRGMARLDAAAHGAPWTFKLLIMPGVVALWPYLALRWRAAVVQKAGRQ